VSLDVLDKTQLKRKVCERAKHLFSKGKNRSLQIETVNPLEQNGQRQVLKTFTTFPYLRDCIDTKMHLEKLL
jgi:hypothetical protein